MGNTQSSKERHEDHTVDYGQLVPYGLYASGNEFQVQTVVQLIVERKLAPFYRPLEDYDESWDDERILAARKVFPAPGQEGTDETAAAAPTPAPPPAPSASTTLSKFRSKDKGSSAAHVANSNDQANRAYEAAIYRGAVECPICLLYYPANINHSRCCDQAICTECFVQIKRADPTPQHLVSEPAACPYCVRDNFGIVYTPPQWRAGINADPRHARPELLATQSSSSTGSKRKSISHTSPDVVTVDQIHPDWEQKLAQVQAAVARRANRRIIMRQVGDRLIPVGVTSGRVNIAPGTHGSMLGDGSGALLVPDAPSIGQRGSVHAGDDSSRSTSRNRGQGRNQDLSQLLGGLGLGGQDLEELMIMEAMRLSLLEHEEQQRREREAAARTANGDASTSAVAPTSSSAPPAPAPLNTGTPPWTSHSHSQSQGGSGSRELSPTAVQNLSTSALGRAALSGALAIGLPSPPSQNQPLPDHAAPSSSSTALGLAALGGALAIGLPAPAQSSGGESATREPVLISVPIDVIQAETSLPTEQQAVASMAPEPVPTPSGSIGSSVNAQLQVPLKPEPATPTTATASLRDTDSGRADGPSSSATSASSHPLVHTD